MIHVLEIKRVIFLWRVGVFDLFSGCHVTLSSVRDPLLLLLLLVEPVTTHSTG